jgi:uncharacterized protein DUF6286
MSSDSAQGSSWDLQDGTLPGQEDQGPPGFGHSRRAGRTRRFWSARRGPAAVVALIVLVASGFLLYDVVSVRAGRPAMAWRRWLAGKLATVPLNDTWMLAACAAIAATGLWLLLLALTPGLRGVLPMRRPSPDIRPALDCSAAALILRDRAMEVPGIQSARVSVGRHRTKTIAVSHFRDLEEVRQDLRAALDQALRQLALAQRPALSVRVKRPKEK